MAKTRQLAGHNELLQWIVLLLFSILTNRLVNRSDFFLIVMSLFCSISFWYSIFLPDLLPVHYSWVKYAIAISMVLAGCSMHRSKEGPPSARLHSVGAKQVPATSEEDYLSVGHLASNSMNQMGTPEFFLLARAPFITLSPMLAISFSLCPLQREICNHHTLCRA